MTDTAPEVRGIDTVAYSVKDYDRALAFWRDTMGLPGASLFEGMGAEFALPDGKAFGFWKVGEDEWTPSGGAMFAFADLHDAVPRLQKRGVKFLQGGHIEESPVCFMAFANDSEGNTFILHQRKDGSAG